MQTTASVSIPYDKLAEFCLRNRVRKLALFGSALDGRLRPDSDIDFLVEFEPGAVVGWKIVTLEDELSSLMGRPVDLKLAGDLSPHIRSKVVNNAQIIYERA